MGGNAGKEENYGRTWEANILTQPYPFGFEGRIWDLIISVPDHCLSFYFAYQSSCGCAMWWP